MNLTTELNRAGGNDCGNRMQQQIPELFAELERAGNHSLDENEPSWIRDHGLVGGTLLSVYQSELASEPWEQRSKAADVICSIIEQHLQARADQVSQTLEQKDANVLDILVAQETRDLIQQGGRMMRHGLQTNDHPVYLNGLEDMRQASTLLEQTQLHDTKDRGATTAKPTDADHIDQLFQQNLRLINQTLERIVNPRPSRDRNLRLGLLDWLHDTSQEMQLYQAYRMTLDQLPANQTQLAAQRVALMMTNADRFVYREYAEKCEEVASARLHGLPSIYAHIHYFAEKLRTTANQCELRMDNTADVIMQGLLQGDTTQYRAGVKMGSETHMWFRTILTNPPPPGRTSNPAWDKAPEW